MNNQWKMVPVEPTEEMLKAFSCNMDGLDELSARNEWRDVLSAAPVPPAGDVECAICLSLGDQCLTCEESEFKDWAEKHFASPDYSQTSTGVYIKDWMRHSFEAWQARSKVVTRLTAELVTQRNHFREQLHDAKNADALQSELTKARELLAQEEDENTVLRGALKDVLDWIDCSQSSAALRSIAQNALDYSATPIAHNVDESCGQDAEAAKGAPSGQALRDLENDLPYDLDGVQ
jgi:hypothetical protein